MIRLMIGIRLREHSDLAAFRSYWDHAFHDALLPFVREGLVARATQSTGLDIERSRSLAARFGTQPGFDAIAELYWESGQALEQAEQDPQFVGTVGRLMVEVREYAAVQDCVAGYTDLPRVLR